MTREEAISEISKIIFELGFEDTPSTDKRVDALNMAIKALEQEPKTGHWIFKNFDRKTGLSNCDWCSECGKPSAQVYKTYCGNCGAKMEGVKE